MTPLPWRVERALDASLAARLVDDAFPDLAPAHAVYLDEGWDSEVYLVNDVWIFRFPKRADTALAPEIDRRILPWIATKVRVPVPRPERFADPSRDFPFPFSGYRRIEGTALDSIPLERIDAALIAGELARLVADLRAIEPAEARAHGVIDERELLPEDARTFEVDRWRHVKPHARAPLAARVDRWFSSVGPDVARGPRVVGHGDLREAHVLVDEAGCRVVGVLDWTDLHHADDARDVAGLLAAFGLARARIALGSVGIALEGELLERARRRAFHVTLAVAWHGALATRPRDLACGLAGLDRATGP